MNREEYKSDICQLYENFTAMSGRKSAETAKKEREKLSQEMADGSLMTASERSVVRSFISGHLGINEADALPYVAGLEQ